MNRKMKRALQKKLGDDFPLEEFCALMAYYSKTMELTPDSFMIYLLKRYIPDLYAEKLPVLMDMANGYKVEVD